eukprot:gene27396-4693_t
MGPHRLVWTSSRSFWSFPGSWEWSYRPMQRPAASGRSSPATQDMRSALPTRRDDFRDKTPRSGSNAFLPTAKAALSSAHASLVSASLTWQEMSAQTQRVSAWGDKTTPSCLGCSRSFASSSKPVYVDPFRDSLQGKPDLAAAAGEGKGEEMVKCVRVGTPVWSSV